MKRAISIFLTVFAAVAIADEFSVFPVLPVSVLDSNNSLCKEESEMYLQNLKNFTLWAHEMWDATAKSSTGLLRGNRFQMGHFEQCLTARAPFRTKYCLTRWTANIQQPKNKRDPLSLFHDPNEHILERIYPYKDVSQQVRNVVQLGWCVPASCSSLELEAFLNNYVNTYSLPLSKENVTYSAEVPVLTCSTQEDNNELNISDICFCSITGILILLVIMTTICDHKIKSNEEKIKKPFLYRCVMSFSAKKNIDDLTKMDESNGALSVLYGIRTISILCIIMDHRFGTFTSAALINFNYVEQQYRAPFAPFLFHGDLFVDTFFVMGGLLVTYCLLNHLDKQKTNPGFIILLRYIRLTPVYAFVIFYYATIFNHSGTGPLWKVIAGQDSQDCKDNWWTNLLYINNYVNADHMCMVHTWYLSCDFHYFIVAVAVCFIIQKGKKLGLSAILFLLVMSIVIPFAITFIYKRPALLHFYPEFLTAPKVHPDFLLTYIKSHTRATPYFIGMIMGYIYYKQQEKTIHISEMTSFLLIILSILFIIISIVGGAVFYNPYHKYNALESSVYAAMHRPAFAIGIGGIMYVCSYGHASYISKFLTWSPWIPLSKLVYGAYLTHMQFQLRAAAIFMNPRHFSYFDVISLSLSDMVLAFLTAFILYLVIEAPFRKIFKEILVPRKTNTNRTDKSAAISEDARNGTNETRM